MRLIDGITSAALLLGAAAPAHALCSYNGVDNAKTTIREEFHDSKWVVDVLLIAADNHWSDEDESWTLYHVKTLRSFKGKAPPRLDVFTYRDSGGFYLDKGMSNDLEGEYLLFLSPATQKLPRVAHGALEVNYPCGQSGPWAKLSRGQLDALRAASKRRWAAPWYVSRARARARGLG